MWCVAVYQLQNDADDDVVAFGSNLPLLSFCSVNIYRIRHFWLCAFGWGGGGNAGEAPAHKVRQINGGCHEIIIACFARQMLYFFIQFWNAKTAASASFFFFQAAVAYATCKLLFARSARLFDTSTICGKCQSSAEWNYVNKSLFCRRQPFQLVLPNQWLNTMYEEIFSIDGFLKR